TGTADSVERQQTGVLLIIIRSSPYIEGEVYSRPIWGVLRVACPSLVPHPDIGSNSQVHLLRGRPMRNSKIAAMRLAAIVVLFGLIQLAYAQPGNPAWIQLHPTGGPPGARLVPATAYDPTTNSMIVFGGEAGLSATSNFYNDVWVLANADGLGGTPAWTPLVPAGVPPAPRRTSVVVYDAANNRLIVFGGSEACGKRNDVWVLSNANGLGGTPVWTPLNPSGALPVVRGEIGSGGVYDAAH